MCIKKANQTTRTKHPMIEMIQEESILSSFPDDCTDPDRLALNHRMSEYLTNILLPKYEQSKEHLGDPSYPVFFGTIEEIRENLREASILYASLDFVRQTSCKSMFLFWEKLLQGLDEVAVFLAEYWYELPYLDYGRDLQFQKCLDFISSGRAFIDGNIGDLQYDWLNILVE